MIDSMIYEADVTDIDYYRVKNQLVGLIDQRCVSSTRKRDIEKHPLLSTSQLVGSVAIKLGDDRIHVNVRHRARLAEVEKPILARTHLGFFAGNCVQIVISPENATTAAEYIDHISYAQSAYLPPKIVKAFVDQRGQSTITRTITLDDSPELLEFVRATETHYRPQQTVQTMVYTGVEYRA